MRKFLLFRLKSMTELGGLLLTLKERFEGPAPQREGNYGQALRRGHLKFATGSMGLGAGKERNLGKTDKITRQHDMQHRKSAKKGSIEIRKAELSSKAVPVGSSMVSRILRIVTSPGL
jgi:hypothetical protein